jgi:peptidoglycan hydrolase-like protein with peptidoglycan-binding domain
VRTEAALLEYEMRWGLTVDGIVDANTWSSLTWRLIGGFADADGSGQVDPWEVGEPPETPDPTPPAPPSPAPGRCSSYRADYAYPIQLCGRGEGVRIAQLGLRIVEPDLDADGYFGPDTHAAVFEFQRTVGLPVTGEIDEPTWVMVAGGLAQGRDADGDGVIDPWEIGLR